MIHQIEANDRAAASTFLPSADFTPMPGNPSAAAFLSVEQEIAKLTWSVLDGSASLTDRQRLATLVDAQHARRRPLNR